ncbi:MAG TPA: shikimate kinase [Dehalococcoidia bacterium]|nr:shikimate kinase [Dehalococcoidia bacterium]
MGYDQVWLTGFMATGKSRLARPIAAALGWEALDVDDLVQKTAGDDIPTIFRRGGEAAFRVLESQVIEELADRGQIVVATGGGSVLAEANRVAMRRHGWIAWLDARPETIARRIIESRARASERPLLDGDDPLQRIIALRAEREPLYAQADFSLQTDDLTPDQCAHQILTAFQQTRSARGRAGGPGTAA